MEYRLSELLDVSRLQTLLDNLDEIYSIPSAIIDTEGNILTRTAWQDVCTKFHRVNPVTERECIKSDTYIVGELSKGGKQVVYRCPRGLVDTATPIVVGGKHVGNAFTGQFFLDPPDEEQYRAIAREYGFDEEAYIEAVRRVPVITEDKHRKNLRVLASITEMLAETGLKQKQQLEIERELRDSKLRLDTILDNVGAYIFIKDTEYRYTYANRKVLDLFGCTADELVGKKDDAFFSKESVEEITMSDRPVIERGETIKREEVDLSAPDGIPRTYLAVKLPLRDSSGRVNSLCGISTDTTDLKHMERELRESRAVLREILDTVPQAIFWKDRESVYLGCNAVFAKAVGLEDVDQIKGKTDFDLPWPKEEAEAYRKDDQEVIASRREKRNIIEPLQQADGTRLWIDTTKVPLLDQQENVYGVLGVYEDITARKEAEEKLSLSERQLKESQKAAKIGNWSWDLVSNTLKWSDETFRRFDKDPETFIPTVDYFVDHIHPDDRKAVHDAIQDTIENDKHYHVQPRIINETGRKWVMEAFGIVERDSNYKPVMFAGTAQDITERKITEERIVKSLEEKELLLKEIHHRVKNNLAIISALLQLQTRYIKNKEFGRAFNESQNRIKSMALVHEKLYGAQDLAKINFKAYMEDLARHLFNSYRKEVGLKIHSDSICLNIDLMIPCGLILNELITNSLKHAFQGIKKPEINISLKTNGEALELIYADNGIGLSKEIDLSKGHTLGLQIVNMLTHQLKGSVDVDRTSGAKFKISLMLPERK